VIIGRDTVISLLAVTVGDEIDVTRLVWHRDLAILRELGVHPLSLTKHQA
jgi:hypothetical protein